MRIRKKITLEIEYDTDLVESIDWYYVEKLAPEVKVRRVSEITTHREFLGSLVPCR